MPLSAPAPQAVNSHMSEPDFLEKSEELLQELAEWAAALEEHVRGADSSLSQGVLSIDVGGGKGKYVINRQTVNRQIWWSSPIRSARNHSLPPPPVTVDIPQWAEALPV